MASALKQLHSVLNVSSDLGYTKLTLTATAYVRAV